MKADVQLAALASHLATRRTAILQAWRAAVDDDPDLTAPSALPRTQFNDHIPELLDAFASMLHAWPDEESAESEARQVENAAGHGLHRWHQGYHLREVVREWGHLQLCLVDELEHYATAHPNLESRVMATARRALAELCTEGVTESAAEYYQLQQAEAVGHVRDLEQTLAQVQDLDQRRAELWQQAAHDLRGNLGVVKNVTSGLTQGPIPEAIRDEFLRLLQKGVSSLHAMLDDVTSLARLQAGYEVADAKPFDAALLLSELCEHLQPLATERSLFLTRRGPATLTVEGDAVKVRRIAQNLAINALKYTRAGGVTVHWGDSRNNDPERWMLCVQDTGPGFHDRSGAPLAAALKEATDEAREIEKDAGKDPGRVRFSESSSPIVPPAGRHLDHQEQGEGIGLSIVKRLCELLDASVELESKHGEGTIFRILFPRRYATP